MYQRSKKTHHFWSTVLKTWSWSIVLSREYSIAIVQPSEYFYRFPLGATESGVGWISIASNTGFIVLASRFFFRTVSGIFFLLENRRIQETQICERVPSPQLPVRAKRTLKYGNKHPGTSSLFSVLQIMPLLILSLQGFIKMVYFKQGSPFKEARQPYSPRCVVKSEFPQAKYLRSERGFLIAHDGGGAPAFT